MIATLFLLPSIVYATTTCGDVKDAFQAQYCCNADSKAFDTNAVCPPPPPTNVVHPPLLRRTQLHEWTGTLTNEDAKAYMHIGFMHATDFNMHAAIVAFRSAQELEPDNPMPYWAHSLVTTTNYNSNMHGARDFTRNDYLVGGYANRTHACVDNVQKALERQHHTGVSDRERAMINAMKVRCVDSDTEDRVGYASAMSNILATYPDDVDVMVQAMFATAYKYRRDDWYKDGNGTCDQTQGVIPPGVTIDPRDTAYQLGTSLENCKMKPDGAAAISLLRDIQAIDPFNHDAAHVAIHVLEQGGYYYTSEPDADVLFASTPLGPHIIHMSAHIYLRMGQLYKGFLAAKESCIRADAYVANTNEFNPFSYNIGYRGHNYQFAVTAAYANGFKEDALELAEGALAVNVIATGMFGGAFTVTRTQVLQIFAEYSDDLSSVKNMSSVDPNTDYQFHHVGLMNAIETNDRDDALKSLNDMALAVETNQDLDFGVGGSDANIDFNSLKNNALSLYQTAMVEMARAVYNVKFNGINSVDLSHLQALDSVVKFTGHIQEVYQMYVTPSLFRGHILLKRGDAQAAYDACRLGLDQRIGVNHMKFCVNAAIDAGAVGTREVIQGKFTNIRSIQTIMDA